jgi:hypothetical protein
MMPRKISDITDGVAVQIRMSKDQRDMFHAIGGHEWLRNYLNRQLRAEEIQLGLSPRDSLVNPSKNQEVKK